MRKKEIDSEKHATVQIGKLAQDNGDATELEVELTLPPSPEKTASPVVDHHNRNRKNPMLRPATAKKMGSESSLFKKKASPLPVSRGVLARSPSSRIRDIDRELRLLESNYIRQMQQCTDIHNQIVALMKEKNNSLNEALL
mmetsp:Transcript_6180/g.10110  ORF Transcript_6180/g.10110 Transcript_6180/m.10110 type:complete len:141 (+) Transcript_6180:1379-1801(+)